MLGPCKIITLKKKKISIKKQNTNENKNKDYNVKPLVQLKP